MLIRNCFLWSASVVVSLLLLAAIPPLTAETPSDAERLQKLEEAVSQLQKRNAELEQEVAGLKKRHGMGACWWDGRQNKKASHLRRKELRRKGGA